MSVQRFLFFPWLVALLVAAGLAPASAGAMDSLDDPASSPPTVAGDATDVDLVVVIKSERVLYMYSNGMIVGQYPVALGKSPLGTKQHQGDNRTPEGAYTLDWRNPDSLFHRSIHVSYPDADDIAAAYAAGQDPGDLIMIHGQPSYDDRPRSGDWTNGCIAVSNAAIDDLWARVEDGARIHIYP